ncbi:amidohydrolase [Kocuria palustris]|nr:amidohydrolase [Kocuria palustris]MDH5151523.1 amidohydrolase [Kocuria palustris]
MQEQLEGQREVYIDLHAHPGLSMHETRTSGIIAERLEGFGFEVHQRVGGGVVGVLANGQGPVVMNRADFDALPVEKRTGLDYASTETTTDEDGRTVPLMHACGHDMHVAALLGAAGAMAAHQEAWSGTFIALFQPGEEIAAGARSMVDDGLTEKVPAPDVVLGQHVMTHEAGTIGTKAGPVLSAGDSIEITLHGSGAHGSMPHLSVDPVVLASTIVMRLQTVVSREIPPSSFAVLTVGSIQAGSKSNIIPATATVLLNMRTYDEDVRSTMITALERIVPGGCEAAGCPQEPEFRYYDQYPLTDNDDDVSAKVTEALRAQFGEGVFEQSPQTASEDFSIVPSAFGVPYTYWTVGGVSKDRLERAESSDDPADQFAPNHSPYFYQDIDPTLESGTKAHLAAALAWLG